MFEVPRSTLIDKVNSKETDVEKLINTQFSRKPALPYIFEELVSYFLMMQRKISGYQQEVLQEWPLNLPKKMV